MAAINDYFLSRNYKALDSELKAQKAIADEYKKKANDAQKEAKESVEKADAYDVVNGDPGATGSDLLKIYTEITGAKQVFLFPKPTSGATGNAAWLKPTQQSQPTKKNVIINGISVAKNTENNKYDVHLKLKEAVAFTVPNVIEKKELTELVAIGITLSAKQNNPKTYGDVKEGSQISGNLTTTNNVFIKNLGAENSSIGDIALNDSNATGEVTLVLSTATTTTTTVDVTVQFSEATTVYAKPLPGKAQA